MWPKMSLSNLNLFFLLAIVDSTRVIFNGNSTPEKTSYYNETGTINQTTSTTVSPYQPVQFQSPTTVPSSQQLQFQSLIPVNNASQAETLILGLINATLNIDKSLDQLNTQYLRPNNNIIISPISIIAAMSLILLGAYGESKTEIAKLFGFNEDVLNSSDQNKQNYKDLGNLLNNFNETSNTRLNVAKAVFIQNDFNITTCYKTIIKEYLNTVLIPVDFKFNGLQAQQIVNKWVVDQTYGNIQDIMQDIPSPDTKTVIASAVYFSGQWEYPFFVNYTRIKPFYFGSNTDVKKTYKQNTKDVIYIPMMVGSSEVLYHKNDAFGFKAIGLSYKDQKCTAYFVLPNNNITLRSLVNRINKNTLRNITKNSKIAEFTYFVPKMVLESFTNLKPVLQNLGIQKVFDPMKANLSNMTSEPHSYISDILHKVEIVFNEVGTVASAATVVTITRGGQSTFNINKPFLFFIHHRLSDTILFWGTVYKPTPYTITPPDPNPHI